MKDALAPFGTPAAQGSGDDAPSAAQFCSVQGEQAFTSPLVPGQPKLEVLIPAKEFKPANQTLPAPVPCRET